MRGAGGWGSWRSEWLHFHPVPIVSKLADPPPCLHILWSLQQKINKLRIARVSSHHHQTDMFQNHCTACSDCTVDYHTQNHGISLNAAFTTGGSCERKKYVLSIQIYPLHLARKPVALPPLSSLAPPTTPLPLERPTPPPRAAGRRDWPPSSNNPSARTNRNQSVD